MFFVVLAVYLVLLFFKTRNVENMKGLPELNFGECDGDQVGMDVLTLFAAIAENKEFFKKLLKTLGNSRLRNDLIKTIPNQQQYRRIQRIMQQVDRRLKSCSDAGSSYGTQEATGPV